jgi:hypothetical protein
MLTSFFAFLHRTFHQNGAIYKKLVTHCFVLVGHGASFLLNEISDYIKRFQEIPVAVGIVSDFLLVLCSNQY